MVEHQWRFFRAGGFDQVRIDQGEDILALAHLDQKLWVALSCPTAGIQFDARTLALLDSDGDGRVRAPEILAVIDWLRDVLTDSQVLIDNPGQVPLSAMNGQSAEGARILASARRILRNLGKTDSDVISLEDTRDTERIFAATAFNGDGIIPPDAAEEPELAAAIRDIMAVMGGQKDRSGRMGIDRAALDGFYQQALEMEGWWRSAPDDRHSLEGAAQATAAVRAKIDDFFTRCRLALFDERSIQPLSRTPEDFAALSGRLLSLGDGDIAAFPLASIAPDAVLPLRHGLNPAWEQPMQVFVRQAVEPLLGDRSHLSYADWQDIITRLRPYEQWQQAKPICPAESVGVDRLLALASPDIHAAIAALLAEDEALRPEADAISLVDKLVRLCRDLHPFLNNFVSFRDFYTGSGPAVFQIGTLFLDGRSCELCVRVDDVAKHAPLASLSRMFLVYCQCRRKGGSETMHIAAAFTAGEADQLTVGRNGVFYDRQGGDWDASVVRVVEHPISIRQAFWSPYRRVGRLIGETVEKVAQARAKSSETDLQQGVGKLGSQMTEPPKSAKPAAVAPVAVPHPGAAPAAGAPFDVGRFAGIFAAMGLALGAMGTAIASVVTGFLNLPWWQIPLALAGLVLAVSGPSMLIAMLKLRQRTLGPILDAGGWAVNAKARINIPFGTALTHLARLPAGAQHALRDPFADPSRTGRWIILAMVGVILAGLAVAGWHYGLWKR